MKEIYQGLATYGLSEQQQKVYVELARLLEANASMLAKKTGIARSTAYTVLESLEEERLVSRFKKNKVLYFTLTNTRQLRRNLEERLTAVDEIMPGLKALVHTATGEPKIQLLTGREGLHAMFEDILEDMVYKNIPTIHTITGRGARSHLPHFDEWKARRKKLSQKTGTQHYIMYPEHVRVLHEKNAHLKRSTHLIKRYFSDEFTFRGTMDIYGDKVAIGSFDADQPHATIITSPEIVALFTMVWKIVWSASQE